MNFYIIFAFIFWCHSLKANSNCSTAPLQIDRTIKDTAATLSKDVYCKKVKKFSGKKPDLKNLKFKVQRALFHTTHFISPIEKQLAEVNDSQKKGSAGLPGFNHEGNSFVVADKEGSLKLVTAKHVVESKTGDFMYVMKDIEKPLFNLSQPLLTVNSDLIAVDTATIVKSKNSDIAILSPTNLPANSPSLPVRDFKNNPLNIEEPVVLYGYQLNKLRSFNCRYRGLVKEKFQHEEFVGYFKCDNKDILLGTISGGVITDAEGNAVAVFNGTLADKKAPNQKNYIIGTPLFLDESGGLATSPFLKESEGICVPCLEFSSDIFSESYNQGIKNCLLLNTSAQTSNVIKTFDQ